MVMPGPRLPSLHVWNGVVLALDEQWVCFYWCGFLIWSCYSCSMQCEVVLSPSCTVQIHYNGDSRSTFIFVEWMERCRVGPGRTGGTFVLLCAWIWSCYSCSMQCEVVISPSCTVYIHHNGAARSVYIYLRCIYGTVSCWPWTHRLCVCIAVCVNLKLLYLFNEVWSRNLMLMCCPNAPHWWWLVYIYLRCIYGTVSCWRWTHRKYVSIAVCVNLKLLFVFDEIVISPSYAL